MDPNPFERLMEIKSQALIFRQGAGRLALCPDLGGRVFAELGGQSLHRIDLACVAQPDQPFNNFGGGNFWPAPEGGKFGFNYRGNQWYVQKAINRQPFEAISADWRSAVIRKHISLLNRAGAVVETVMRRELTVLAELPDVLGGILPERFVAYQTVDAFQVTGTVTTDRGLIGAWTLDQFDASPETISFCAVDQPREAINFDFYEHPGTRIGYHRRGFTYATDGRCRGQIGIRRQAGASRIGFYDRSRNLVCIRENIGPREGLFFNIADNDQPAGPFSAADNYSIFNSGPESGFFELETIGPAQVENGRLRGSEVVSRTTFAWFKDATDVSTVVHRALDD